MQEFIETMSAAEAAEKLRSLGVRISPENLRNGLQQKVYPFGDCVMMNGKPRCTVYTVLLEAWIQERTRKEA